MTKFEKVSEPMEMDFYSIEMNDRGEKQIHISGFTEKGDEWRCIDVCWFIEPLEKFIKHVSELKDHVGIEYATHTQYQKDYLEKGGIVRTINEYFDGKPADYILSFPEITIDSPCGNYVSLFYRQI